MLHSEHHTPLLDFTLFGSLDVPIILQTFHQSESDFAPLGANKRVEGILRDKFLGTGEVLAFFELCGDDELPRKDNDVSAFEQ